MDETSTVMPVQPMNYGYGFPMMGGFNNGFGGFGGDWAWVILLLLAFNGDGWGGFGGFGGFGGGLGIDFPWILNGQNQINANTNSGFDHAATQSAIGNLSTAVTSGFGDVQTALCGGFAGVNATVNGAQNAITQQMYANQIADLNRSFAAQTASTAGMSAIQSQLAQCCCDNRLATESLRATVLSENCAGRYEAANNTRDIIDSQTRGTQAILDKLCQLELDTVKTQLAQAQRDNVGLQNQLNMANLATSQTAQTAQILAGQTAEVDALYNRLNSCPVPTTPVYGRTPIFTCNNGCGCSGNTGFVG